jgi:hypothetical protein
MLRGAQRVYIQKHSRAARAGIGIMSQAPNYVQQKAGHPHPGASWSTTHGGITTASSAVIHHNNNGDMGSIPQGGGGTMEVP